MNWAYGCNLMDVTEIKNKQKKKGTETPTHMSGLWPFENLSVTLMFI